MEKDLCGGGGGGGGVVYFTVLCDHPYLVSIIFAVLVSLHPVTYSNVVDYFTNRFHTGVYFSVTYSIT